MNKNISTFLAAGITTEIPAKYFAADLEASDLLGIVSSHPILFWTSLAVLVIVSAVYCIYHCIKKKTV